jgi:hypothetical protein
LNILKYSLFFDFEEIIFENFKISENNINSVELAKVLGCILQFETWVSEKNSSLIELVESLWLPNVNTNL